MSSVHFELKLFLNQLFQFRELSKSVSQFEAFKLFENSLNQIKKKKNR